MMNYDMTPSEMLCAFLDGELDTQEAGSLFYHLAQNPELQSEMRQHILMRGAVQSARHYAPEKAKEKLLVRTGLISAGIAAAGAGSSWFQNLNKGNMFGILGAAIMSSLLTAAVFMSGGSATDTDKAQTGLAVSRNTEIPAPAASKPEIRYIEKKVYVDRPYYITKYVSVAEPAEEKNNISGDAETPQPQFAGIDGSFIPSGTSPLLLGSRNGAAFSPAKVTRPASRVAVQEPEEELHMELRGFNSNSYPTTDVALPSSSVLDNKSINISMKITNSSYFGFEMGKENFVQIYSGVENGRNVQYEQNYPAWWAGLSYQHNFTPMNNITPFVRLIAAGTRTGPLAKGIVGAQYAYDDMIFFGLGLDMSYLLYEYQDQVFSTRKFGVSYSLGLKF